MGHRRLLRRTGHPTCPRAGGTGGHPAGRLRAGCADGGRLGRTVPGTTALLWAAAAGASGLVGLGCLFLATVARHHGTGRAADSRDRRGGAGAHRHRRGRPAGCAGALGHAAGPGCGRRSGAARWASGGGRCPCHAARTRHRVGPGAVRGSGFRRLLPGRRPGTSARRRPVVDARHLADRLAGHHRAPERSGSAFVGRAPSISGTRAVLPLLVASAIGDTGGNLFFVLSRSETTLAVSVVLSSLVPGEHGHPGGRVPPRAPVSKGHRGRGRWPCAASSSSASAPRRVDRAGVLHAVTEVIGVTRDRHVPCTRMTSPGTGGRRWGTTIVWFRRDLRIHDHPALVDAISNAERVVPLFVLDPGLLQGRWPSANRARLSAGLPARPGRAAPEHRRASRRPERGPGRGRAPARRRSGR